MIRATSLSTLSSSFPTTEISYDDLIGMPYRPGGRYGNSFIDCLGVVLEVYARAGLGLPDPVTSTEALLAFSEIFEEIPIADTLYDLVDLRHRQHHLMVVVRPGLLLSAKERAGVYAPRTKAFIQRDDVTYWRLRADAYPI